ncbi:MAG: hypothetical protein U0Q15_18025 [Kineosporiaceae bacterium]
MTRSPFERGVRSVEDFSWGGRAHTVLFVMLLVGALAGGILGWMIGDLGYGLALGVAAALLVWGSFVVTAMRRGRKYDKTHTPRRRRE